MSNFQDAQSVLVGGVNSPVRAFKGVGGEPIFVRLGKGAYFEGEDDRSYLDFVLSWGPLILGHAPDVVLDAITKTAHQGTSFGAPCVLETQLATLVQSLIPSIEKIRFVSSGTEATMSALRLARGFTGRSKIIKFEGCYHGHADSLLVAAGSGGLTLGTPNSAGVPDAFVSETVVVPYNDLAVVKAVMSTEIAGIILEPVCGNMGLIQPQPGFLEGLRALCDEHGALLIVDEVMTGFRHQGFSAHALYGITPDLTCLGKVIGGGLPCGAFGGRAEIMDRLAPLGDVYQAGTLSGNPLAMAAGIATLSELKRIGLDGAISKTTELAELLRDVITSQNLEMQVDHVGTMWGIFCKQGEVRNLADVTRCDFECFSQLFHHFLDHGVYIAPSQYEAGFMSVVHTSDDLQRVTNALADFKKK